MAALLAFYLSTLMMLAPIVTCVGIGLIWTRRNLPFAGNFLGLLVTSVTTPALVFHTLVTTELDNRVLMEIGLATSLALGFAAVFCAVGLKLLRLPVRELLQTATFPNAGNIGLPLAMVAFGQAGFSGAIVFMAVCSFFQNTIGVRSLPGAAAVNAWRSPVVVTTVIAVVCRSLNLELPSWALESAEMVGSLTVPLMLISLGAALAYIPASGLRTGSWIAGLRLLAGAAGGVLAGWVCGLDASLAGLITLQMTMPCAVLSYMYASRYTDKGELSAGAVLVSTIAFLLLSPAILAAVGAPLGAPG
jgi:predicted permease